MKKVFIILSFLLLLFILLIFALGYRIPNPNKHSEIPFFPKITNENLFVNKDIDSMYIESYFPLKDTQYLFVEYDKDTINYNETRIAILTKNLKPVFFLKSKTIRYKYYEKKKLLFLANDSTQILYDVNARKIKNFSNTELQETKENVKDGQLVSVTVAGDKGIKTHNIRLFDIAITSNKLKNISLPTPSSNSSGRTTGYEDKGIFDKEKLYFFSMKLKNDEVKFKTDLFYNSDIYFDELNVPKSDKDTLLYYCHNRFYRFYKK